MALAGKRGKQKAYGCCLPSLSPFHSLSNQLANHQLKSEAGKKRRESKTIRQQLSSPNTHHHHLTCFERKRRRRRKRKIRSSGCTAFLKDITNDDLMEEQTNKHHPLFTSSKWTQGRRSHLLKHFLKLSGQLYHRCTMTSKKEKVIKVVSPN